MTDANSQRIDADTTLTLRRVMCYSLPMIYLGATNGRYRGSVAGNRADGRAVLARDCGNRNRFWVLFFQGAGAGASKKVRYDR